MIRVPYTSDGQIDYQELKRRYAAEAGLPEPVTSTAEEQLQYLRERVQIEQAIGMQHLKRSCEHLREIERLEHEAPTQS